MKCAIPAALTLCVFFAVTLRSEAGEDPSEMWMTGYLQIQDALKAEEQKKLQEAIAKFQIAIFTYLDIAKRYPAFESERRISRIRLLADKISSLGAVAVMEPGSFMVGGVAYQVTGKVEERFPLSLPEGWQVNRNGVKLNAVITPESDAYISAYREWWKKNGGRIRFELAHSR